MIFVSICSYRDPELRRTISDCVAKASRPDQLRLGVCHQGDSRFEQPELPRNCRLQVLEVPWQESRGTCWARSQVQRQLWNGEDFYLQLDSHHRFAPNWDTSLIAELNKAPSPHPVLTAYCPDFSPDQSGPMRSTPMQIVFDHFSPEGIPFFRPITLEVSFPGAPVRARFLSAHLLFAPGEFVTKVPYDPNLYILGEESTLAMRAYTNGFDLFHPATVTVWHQYFRGGRPLHWDDHKSDDDRLGSAEQDRRGRARAVDILTNGPGAFGPFGCGDKRTVADYERFAGISFRDRHVDDQAQLGLEPPSIGKPQPRRGRPWRFVLRGDYSAASDTAFSQADYWEILMDDGAGQPITRWDISKRDVDAYHERGSFARECHFFSSREPRAWRVRSHIPFAGWVEVVAGDMPRSGALQADW